MTYSHYERLSALDSVFLDIEERNAHMHIGSVALFDAKPLTTPEGGLDIDRILEFSEIALDRSPRFRQKLAYVPAIGNPVWVDDDKFNLTYHMRHVRLPVPGGERLLKRLAGRIMSQELDRGKPLWEIWFVEGVENDRFAVISKIHHCLADGISGVELWSNLMGPNPNYKPKRSRHQGEWFARPKPSARQLLTGEISHRVTAPLELLTPSVGLAAGRDTASGLSSLASGFADLMRTSMTPASETPFDAKLGPHRRFDWAQTDLTRMREIKSTCGCKINDVALTVIGGALAQFLRHRNVAVDKLDFRVMVPVSMRNPDAAHDLGNQVSLMLLPMPLAVRDPLDRLAEISKETAHAKASHRVDGADFLVRLVDAAAPELSAPLAKLGMMSHAANLVVTNVPGPPTQVYFLGAPLLATYPVVPLAANMALGVALLSYNETLYWGFNSDWDVLPDLHDLALAVEEEFETLSRQVARPKAASRRRAAKKTTRKKTTKRTSSKKKRSR